MVITLILLFALSMTGATLNAQVSQSQSQSNLQQEYNFDNESGEKTIELKVGALIEMIGFNIQSQISSGSLEMSIFDPNGKRDGGFTLQAHENANSSGQEGSTNSQVIVTSGSNSNSNSSTNLTLFFRHFLKR